MFTTENLKARAFDYFDRLLNKKQISVCDEMLALNYIDHDAPTDMTPGPERIKEFVLDFIKTYPDISLSVDDVIAEGNKVVLRNTWRGTNKDTGEILNRIGIVILRFDDNGQVVERWSTYSDK